MPRHGGLRPAWATARAHRRDSGSTVVRTNSVSPTCLLNPIVAAFASGLSALDRAIHAAHEKMN
jgi:hypothetical protein